MKIVPISRDHDTAVAELVRCNLKAHKLDIPGAAYFDEALDRLSEFYNRPGRAYFVLIESGEVVGGVGLAAFDGDCRELQKLYLADSAKRRGLGYNLMLFIEDWAHELGYSKMYHLIRIFYQLWPRFSSASIIQMAAFAQFPIDSAMNLSASRAVFTR
ncbi:MAG: GNAT family N-acetyltransferase [Clostridia bacterium]|nr:GNAT family N-acetyltransferase [Clostridia bacterium]